NFITGSAPGHQSPSFPPPAPLVAAEVRRVTTLRVTREARFRKLLPPPEPEIEPEERARVAAGFRRLNASMAKAVEPIDAMRAARRKERGEEELRWLRDRGDLVEVKGAAYPI